MAMPNVEIIYESTSRFSKIAAAMEDFANDVQCTVQDNPVLHILTSTFSILHMIIKRNQRLTLSTIFVDIILSSWL